MKLWKVPQALKGFAPLQELEEETDIDFFSRFTYKVPCDVTSPAAVGSADCMLTLLIELQPSEDKFGPETVPVYCACEVCKPEASLLAVYHRVKVLPVPITLLVVNVVVALQSRHLHDHVRDLRRVVSTSLVTSSGNSLAGKMQFTYIAVLQSLICTNGAGIIHGA